MRDIGRPVQGSDPRGIQSGGRRRILDEVLQIIGSGQVVACRRPRQRQRRCGGRAATDGGQRCRRRCVIHRDCDCSAGSTLIAGRIGGLGGDGMRGLCHIAARRVGPRARTIGRRRAKLRDTGKHCNR